MSFTNRLIHWAEKSSDVIVDLWPAPTISDDQLRQAKIVAHRGFRGPGAKENTCSSLGECHTHGVWGVEFDVRWTMDDVPILLHDPSTARVFGGLALWPEKMRAQDLFQRCEVASLAQVVKDLGGRCHLMIELKVPLTAAREETLALVLQSLTPVIDYHLLTLNPDFLMNLKRFPRDCFVFVTELDIASASVFVTQHRWGGIAGHYLMLTERLIQSHHEAGQKVGVGFVASPNNLCRQLGRGVDWVFSNHAPALQAWRQARLDRSQGSV
jgi:glycerophosphoryl diester phosphodiesterase